MPKSKKSKEKARRFDSNVAAFNVVQQATGAVPKKRTTKRILLRVSK